MEINEIARQIHENSVDKGWWSDSMRPGAEIIALCHAELSEALEEMRDGKPGWYYEPKNACSTTLKPEGWIVEMLDCVIRIFDYLAGHEVDIERVLLEKHEFNKTRERKHGKIF